MGAIPDYYQIPGTIPGFILERLPEGMRDADQWELECSYWCHTPIPEWARIMPSSGQGADRYIFANSPNIHLQHGGFTKYYDWWILSDEETQTSKLVFSVSDPDHEEIDKERRAYI